MDGLPPCMAFRQFLQDLEGCAPAVNFLIGGIRTDQGSVVRNLPASRVPGNRTRSLSSRECAPIPGTVVFGFGTL